MITYRERTRTSSTALLGREQVTAARSAVWLLLKELTTRGQLSITAAFLSRLPSAAARLWQQVPRQNANGIISLEETGHVLGPYECVVAIVVVGLLCLLLALMARTASARLRQNFVVYGRCSVL